MSSQTWQRRLMVTIDVESYREGLQTLFPTASLQVSDSGEVLVVQGLLRSADQAEQLHRYLDQKKITYVDMTSVAGIQQVQLQVRVAEVSRAALKTLGINGFQTDDDFFFGQRVGSSAGGPDRTGHQHRSRRRTSSPATTWTFVTRRGRHRRQPAYHALCGLPELRPGGLPAGAGGEPVHAASGEPDPGRPER